jgi:hypothetical protein
MANMDDAIRTDAGLLAFSSQFSAKITLAPTSYGLTAANATSYAAAQSDFATKLAASTDPATRGEATIYQKNLSRDALVAITRQFARQIQGTMTVTNEQRQELGLPVRSTEPTPINPPAMAPTVEVKEVIGNTVVLKIHNPDSPKRGRPAGVAGIALFSAVADEAPTTEAGWEFQGNTTRGVVNCTLPASVAPGSKVWFTAFYFNPRLQSGPAASAVWTNLQGGSAMAA